MQLCLGSSILKSDFATDYQDGDLICCQPDGAVWRPSAFTSAYRDLLRRRKLSGPNFHALRHSHASHLIKNGVDIKQVSARLGHAKAGFTLNTYITFCRVRIKRQPAASTSRSAMRSRKPAKAE